MTNLTKKEKRLMAQLLITETKKILDKESSTDIKDLDEVIIGNNMKAVQTIFNILEKLKYD